MEYASKTEENTMVILFVDPNASDLNTLYRVEIPNNDSQRLCGGADASAPIGDEQDEQEEEEDDDLEPQPVPVPVATETATPTTQGPAKAGTTIEEQLKSQKRTKLKKSVKRWSKMSVVLLVWFGFTIALLTKNLHEEKNKMVVVEIGAAKNVILEEQPKGSLLGVTLSGHFQPLELYGNDTVKTPNLLICVQRLFYNQQGKLQKTETVSNTWKIVTVPLSQVQSVRTMTNIFNLSPKTSTQANSRDETIKYQLHFSTVNFNESIPMEMGVNAAPIDRDKGVIYASLLLIFLYVLIIWEIVDRNFAALLCSIASVGILCLLNARPSMDTIISWINFETLLLLFSMMMFVSVLSETGAFDYLAVLAFKTTRGRFWPLLVCLCLFTGLLSALLDNVTMVLLMAPVAIRLCEVMNLLTAPVLISMVIFSNIGGTLTAVGDPPNVIIASNSYLAKNGVDFYAFFLHMLPCVVFVMFTTFVHLRMYLRKASSIYRMESDEQHHLRQEIATLKRTAANVLPYTATEDRIRQRLLELANEARRNLRARGYNNPLHSTRSRIFHETVEHLRAKYGIRHKKLLIMSIISLIFVLFLFCQTFLPISMDWAALLGAMLLLILGRKTSNLDAILKHIEWGTLLFFASLFVLMEAVSNMGLIDWIGDKVVIIVNSVEQEARLTVALLLMLWVTALTSAFVDNIPITTMMVKLVIALDQNRDLKLPLTPMVWALALGACLGGNGTLIGASANVVCAGVAKHHGYSFTFMQFFKFGFPIMISSIIVASVYLILAHVVYQWH